MKAQELRAVVQWMELADIATVEMSTPRFSLRLVRRPQVATPGGEGAAAPGLDAGGCAPVRLAAEAAGAFHAGHPLRARPLAQCGAAVNAGDVLGLIRIDGMLYLPVVAPRKGRVLCTLVNDGARVAAGAALFEFEPATDRKPLGANP